MDDVTSRGNHAKAPRSNAAKKREEKVFFSLRLGILAAWREIFSLGCPGRQETSVEVHQPVGGAARSVNRTWAPSPGCDCTEMVPPILSTSALHRARPMPAPRLLPSGEVW